MEKYFHFDRNKSLQELDGQDWSEPDVATPLIRRCHELRKKAVGYFIAEDLRIMIGQNIGLEYLVPLALETLEDNILVAGDLYNGDLLDSVLKADSRFWTDNPVYKDDLEHLLQQNIDDLNDKLGSFRQRLI